MELVEILGVVFAHEGDLVEWEHYGVVESHGERLGNAGKVDGMGYMRKRTRSYKLISHSRGAATRSWTGVGNVLARRSQRGEELLHLKYVERNFTERILTSRI